MKQNVIVIFAPTASGKTALTKELFSLSGSHFVLNAEIISADSQAVYKGMDIGTAKSAGVLVFISETFYTDFQKPPKVVLKLERWWLSN